ncbi:unnamed protein product [Spirodela intermedia]|uniref:Uncharacterized protein n=1 Tax=Spirodela intermedia TaxID=51605 RepID=A0A7I8JAE9_SPIIN|nr:unnamed protein product [Spirodela intermedia]CAA6667188.1 unnamed protein product [Spirodela intermedia]
MPIGTDRGTCVPLPFHVTSGQPAVGQGVVVHKRTIRREMSHHLLKHTRCDEEPPLAGNLRMKLPNMRLASIQLLSVG